MSIRFRSIPTGETRDTGECEPNLNLLAHAQLIELDLGSQCGGHGVCGKDRIQLPVGARESFSTITDEERRHLSPKELAQGWRLSCQCFPEKRDCDVEIAYPGPAG